MRGSKFVQVTGCARCGDTHTDLLMTEMVRSMSPAECAPLSWTHFALCPTYGDPIMMGVTAPDTCDKDKAVKKDPMSPMEMKIKLAEHLLTEATDVNYDLEARVQAGTLLATMMGWIE